MTVVSWDDLTEEQKREIIESPAVQEAFGYRLIADGIDHLEENEEELADRMIDHTHQRMGRLKRETVEEVLNAFREVIKERTAPIPSGEEYDLTNNVADSTEAN